jgi:hypothetical protein
MLYSLKSTFHYLCMAFKIRVFYSALLMDYLNLLHVTLVVKVWCNVCLESELCVLAPNWGPCLSAVDEPSPTSQSANTMANLSKPTDSGRFLSVPGAGNLYSSLLLLLWFWLSADLLFLSCCAILYCDIYSTITILSIYNDGISIMHLFPYFMNRWGYRKL